MAEPRSSSVGKAGLALSFLPWVTYLSMLIFQAERGSPVGTLTGFLIMLGPPVALIVSVVGLFKDTAKGPAIAGTIISTLTLLVLILLVLIGMRR